MIVDSHAHLDESEAFGWEHTPSKLLKLMDAADIDKAVVTTYADEPGPEDGVERLNQYVKNHPDRFIGFPRMDPRYGEEAIDIFEHAVIEYGMAGLKLHPVSNLSHPISDLTGRILDKAAELNVPVLFHSGDRVMCLPHQIGEAASRTDATILMGHIGGYFHPREAVAVARQHENIILESSAFPYPRVLQDAIDSIGADRIVYGSDQPAANPHVELQKIEVLDISPEQKQKILYKNIMHLIGNDGEVYDR